jgi:hypothetical protein
MGSSAQRALERTIERNPGRRGIKLLRALMAMYVEPDAVLATLRALLGLV